MDSCTPYSVYPYVLCTSYLDQSVGYSYAKTQINLRAILIPITFQLSEGITIKSEILLDRKSVGARPWLNYRCTSNNALLTSGFYGGKLGEIVGMVGLETELRFGAGQKPSIHFFLGVKKGKKEKHRVCVRSVVFCLSLCFCLSFVLSFFFYDVTLEGNQYIKKNSSSLLLQLLSISSTPYRIQRFKPNRFLGPRGLTLTRANEFSAFRV